MTLSEKFGQLWMSSTARQVFAILTTVAVVVSVITVTAIIGTPVKPSDIISAISNSDDPDESGSVPADSVSVTTGESGMAESGPDSGSPASVDGKSDSVESKSSSRISSMISSILSGTSSQNSSGSPSPTTGQTGGKEYYRSQIGIWYTVWWQNNNASNPYKAMYSHWADWSRMEPVRGFYSSGDPEIIKTHMSLFNKYGIDYVLLDDTNGHGNDAGSIGANIDKVFATVRSMGAGKAPQVAIALGGEFNNGTAADPYGSRQSEADLVYSRYAQNYSDIYFKWKNKPLMVSYGLVKYQSWNDIRFTVRRATGNVNEWRFSGTPLPATGLWGWVFNSQVDNTEVYGVVPGFNKGPIQGNTANSTMDQIKREKGDHYMGMWLGAIAANRETIVITSWNDFAEEPSIEAMNPRPDSQVTLDAARVGWPMDVRHARDLQNGDDRHNIWLDYYGVHAPYWYEEITWAYASLKTTLLENYYYRETGSADVYQYKNRQLVKQTEMPHGHPVIKIPDGYFEWFLG